jgi:membrane protease YdiL (CAAX protease family)
MNKTGLSSFESSSKPSQPRAIVLAIITLLSWHQLMPRSVWVSAALFLVLPWAIRSECLPAIHLSVLAALMCLMPFLFYFHPPFLILKAALLLPYFIIVALITPLRHSLDWLRRGTFGLKTWGLVVGITLFAGVVLSGWVHFVNPNLGRYTYYFPAMPSGMLFVYAAGFAAINALIEEIIWRGIMLSALDAVLGVGPLALVLQALQFGIAHYRGGFPNGWLGIATTGLFGFFMGLVRRSTNGLFACWIAHAAADFTILCLVIHFVRQSAGH